MVSYHKDDDLIEYYHYEDMMYRVRNKEEIEDESYH